MTWVVATMDDGVVRSGRTKRDCLAWLSNREHVLSIHRTDPGDYEVRTGYEGEERVGVYWVMREAVARLHGF